VRLAGLFARRDVLPERDVLEFPDASLTYAIRASARRRTLSLELRADGSLTVATPRGLSLATIRAFVESRRAWIEAKRALLTPPAPRRILPEHGARLPYLGTELALNVSIAPSRRAACRCESGNLVLKVPHNEAIRPAIEAWYRRAAATHAAARLAHFAPQVGSAARKLVMRAQRPAEGIARAAPSASTGGSCRRRRKFSTTWWCTSFATCSCPIIRRASGPRWPAFCRIGAASARNSGNLAAPCPGKPFIQPQVVFAPRAGLISIQINNSAGRPRGCCGCYAESMAAVAEEPADGRPESH
jgi:predicted metal-dependent hydrolase